MGLNAPLCGSCMQEAEFSCPQGLQRGMRLLSFGWLQMQRLLLGLKASLPELARPPGGAQESAGGAQARGEEGPAVLTHHVGSSLQRR